MTRRTIYKYQVPVGEMVTLWIPNGYVLRHVGAQEAGSVTLWAEVDPDEAKIGVSFLAIGTGFDFNIDGLEFVGSVQAGSFVWHLYRLIP